MATAPPSPLILSEPDTSPGPFEGPEKLLEVWFAPGPDGLASAPAAGPSRREGQRGLRGIPRKVWEDMLDIVKCKVLSVVEGQEIDAYLLSESSLFVAPHFVVLKTCGTTLNLLGLYRIIEIAREYCGFTNVWRCFYSRKSFFFPERQLGVHRDWTAEVAFLDSVFGASGSAYTVGPVNRDHWLLYLTGPNTTPLLPGDAVPKALALGGSSSAPALAPATRQPQPQPTRFQDQTLEILMTHLSPAARAPFFVPDTASASSASSASASASTSGHALGASISRQLGIDALFPAHETVLDSFGFEPCGYSANAVIGTGHPETAGAGGLGGGYFTIHVTPEDGWSYASFECNVPLPQAGAGTASGAGARPDLQQLVRRVVDIFQPGRLSVTLFVSTASASSSLSVPAPTPLDAPLSPPSTPAADAPEASTPAELRAWRSIGADLLGPGFVRKDRIGYEFDGYDLVFGCFERRGWVEPKPAAASGGTPAEHAAEQAVQAVADAADVALQ
ncbi:spermidine resistance protein [Cryptotrichosporon argae]